jgi:hypothetical protein
MWLSLSRPWFVLVRLGSSLVRVSWSKLFAMDSPKIFLEFISRVEFSNCLL